MKRYLKRYLTAGVALVGHLIAQQWIEGPAPAHSKFQALNITLSDSYGRISRHPVDWSRRPAWAAPQESNGRYGSSGPGIVASGV